MAKQPVHLPDGMQFEFWDDRTQYRKVYHVAGGSANGAK